MPEVICEWCGKEFHKVSSQIKRSKHHFCSRICWKKYLKNNHTFIICESCGKKIQITNYRFSHNMHHYCSVKCANIGRNHKLIVTCAQCGKELLRKPSQIRKSNHQFCSCACYHEFTKNRYRVPRKTVSCTYCGQLIVRLSTELERVQNPFCSQKCFQAWLRENPPSGDRFRQYNLTVKKGHTWEEIYGDEKAARLRQHYSETMVGENNPNYGNHVLAGENNPNWRGGTSAEPYAFEFDAVLKDQIIQRDEYHCQMCRLLEQEHLQQYGKRLSVHHIDYDKRNNDPSNLIALCQRCHTKTNHRRQYHKYLLTEQIAHKEQPV